MLLIKVELLVIMVPSVRVNKSMADWTVSFSIVVNWLDHSRTLREQGVSEGDTLLLQRKLFFSDQNIDARDPVQLNLLYVQVC